MRASAGNEDGTKKDAMSRRLLRTVARRLGSRTGRRRSTHLTAGGLIGVSQPHELFRLKQTCHGDVFVDFFPMDADAATDGLPLVPLLRCGIQEPRKPR